MATRLAGQALEINGRKFLGCTKIVDVSCEDYTSLGLFWMVPRGTRGGGIGYERRKFATKPTGTSVRVAGIRENSTGRVTFFAVADDADPRIIANLCNLCCGVLPQLPFVNIPDPLIEEVACAVIPAPAATGYNITATGEPLATGERYYAIASKNGVLLTPPGANTGYATIATLRTFLSGNYGGSGTWTQNGQSIIFSDVNPFNGAFQIYAIPQLADNAGADQSLVSGTTTTTLTGTATGQSKVLWTKVSGPGTQVITSPNSLTTGITGLQAGTFVFRLTATNVAGSTITDDISVVVAA